MSTVDINALLQELDPTSPCGLNLEYAPDFVELELAVQGKPEVQYGDTITPPVPPEWKRVKQMATELLERSRDLRLAVMLLRANLSLHGIEGMADCLGLIERLLDERWESVHPELDADDDMDPTLRVNSLAVLADSTLVLKELKSVTFVVLPGLGPLSLRLLDIANGEMAPATGEEKLAMSSIEAAIGDVEQSKLKIVADLFARAYASVVHIEVILVRNVGNSQTVNLDGLTRSLKRGRDFLLSHLTDSMDTSGTAQAPADQHDGGSSLIPRNQSTFVSSEISNRTDVLRMIKSILKYYQLHEPSSPVPLLLERAERLVPKSFWESMEDLAPDGMAQLQIIKGNQSEIQND